MRSDSYALHIPKKVMHMSCNSHPTQVHFWGDYICLLLLLFWINKLQTTPLLPGERSLTAPDGGPSRLNMHLESSNFMVVRSLLRPTTTGLQFQQRRLEALATTYMLITWISMGRVKTLFKISSSPLISASIPLKHKWDYLLLEGMLLTSDSYAVHVPRWHRKMKNLTSLDFSSDLYDNTNYIV